MNTRITLCVIRVKIQKLPFYRKGIIIIIIIIKLALQHAHIKLRIMTCASTITLCMLEGMLASSASTLKVYNVH